MAGNSQRRGAVRKSGKGATVGSGGQRRKGLEGRGPTPKAVDREHHPAHKRATSAARGVAKAGAPAGRSGGSTSGGSSGQRSAGASRYAGAKGSGGRAGGSGGPGRGAKPSAEMVAGRNPVVQALRADI
ncbi:MAG TPA: hypothetical protein PKC73_09610, partial [Dermatophilaceae bacterium]|nr:hypothetical protein [Dermatophilaceae bacterium]